MIQDRIIVSFKKKRQTRKCAKARASQARRGKTADGIDYMDKVGVGLNGFRAERIVRVRLRKARQAGGRDCLVCDVERVVTGQSKSAGGFWGYGGLKRKKACVRCEVGN